MSYGKTHKFMIYIQFLLGLLAYCAAASISYFDAFKVSKFYIPAGIAIGIVCNIIWLSIAKNEKNPSLLMLKGLYWDCMLMGVYLLIPFLFFKAQINTTQALGILLVITGLVLTKV